MPTKIEWSQETWNCVTGCTPISAGCQHCYAARMAKRLAGRYGYPADEPFRVTIHPDRLDEPLHWKKPRRVFVVSMGDMFHKDVPMNFIGRVWQTIVACPRHTFQVLTKRPARMKIWFDGYSVVLKGVWLGVTAENQRCFDERIPHLLQCPAAVRWVSLEPLLESMQIEAHLGGIDWAVVGCETGPGARPCKIEWVRGIVDQCKAAGVPVFVKQLRLGNRVVKDIEQFPEDLRVREYPRAHKCP